MICLPRSLTDAFLDRAFSTTDVSRAVSRGANGKASGPDRLTNECMKYALGVLHVPLTNLFNFCFSRGCCPPQWCHSYLLTLYKGKCSKSDPNSPRGIVLQSRLLNSILLLTWSTALPLGRSPVVNFLENNTGLGLVWVPLSLGGWKIPLANPSVLFTHICRFHQSIWQHWPITPLYQA